STIANVLLINLLDMGGQDAAERRLGSKTPFLRTRFFQGTPRYQYSLDWVRSFRDYEKSWIATCAPIAPYDVTRKEVHARPRSRSANAAIGRVFTRKRLLEFSRNSLVSRIPMRNLRMRKL